MRGNKLFKFVDRYAGIPLLIASSLWTRPRRGSGSLVPSRILVMKFSALGDAILLIPSLRALKAKYPSAEIIFLGTPFTLPFLRQFGEYISEFIPLDLGKIAKRPWTIVRVIRQLRGLHIDVVVDFEQWMRLSAFLASCTGARVRAGFRTPHQHRHFAFTASVPRDRARHEVENFLSVAALLTGPTAGTGLEVKLDEGSLVRAQGFLMRHGWERGMPVVLLHPGCGEHGYPREWNPERYAELIRTLMNGRAAICIVSGTGGERPVMERVVRSAQVPVVLYNITTLEDFAALASLATLFISSNNGAMHLVAALGLRQIALHGPTNFRQWGPLNPNAIVIQSSCPECPCLDLGFEYHRVDGYCMDQISVNEVWEKVAENL